MFQQQAGLRWSSKVQILGVVKQTQTLSLFFY